MDETEFKNACEAINEHQGVEEIYLLDSDGIVLFKNKDFDLNENQSKALLKAWKDKEPSLHFLGNRFAILKNDDIQLAAKNIAGGAGNVAGSITKNGDYLVIHTAEETGMILLEWSIFVNKIAWK